MIEHHRHRTPIHIIRVPVMSRLLLWHLLILSRDVALIVAGYGALMGHRIGAHAVGAPLP